MFSRLMHLAHGLLELKEFKLMGQTKMKSGPKIWSFDCECRPKTFLLNDLIVSKFTFHLVTDSTITQLRQLFEYKQIYQRVTEP